MFVSGIARPLMIAGLVVAEVGLWQWRMVVAHRDQRVPAVALGAVGAILQITAISQVVTNVNDPLTVAAYAIGVGLGILVGLMVGERFSSGTMGVTIITAAPAAAERLWALGWSVTAQSGESRDGPVTLITAVIDRREVGQWQRDVAWAVPDAFSSAVAADGTKDARILIES